MIQQLYEIFRRNRKKLLGNIENNQKQQCSHGLIVMTQKQFNKFWLYQLTRGISFTILLLACSFILTLIRCILLPWTWSKRTNSWARWDLPLFLHLWRKKCFGGTTFTVSPIKLSAQLMALATQEWPQGKGPQLRGRIVSDRSSTAPNATCYNQISD